MSIFWAVIFLVSGFILRFQVNTRQFNRRNSAGVEEFSSYGSAYTTRLLEKFGRYIAVFLIIIGILMALSFFFGSSPK